MTDVLNDPYNVVASLADGQPTSVPSAVCELISAVKELRQHVGRLEHLLLPAQAFETLPPITKDE